jgi:hypothetical protein
MFSLLGKLNGSNASAFAVSDIFKSQHMGGCCGRVRYNNEPTFIEQINHSRISEKATLENIN